MRTFAWAHGLRATRLAALMADAGVLDVPPALSGD